MTDEYRNPNEELIRSISSRSEPDWKAFERCQEEHARAYTTMLDRWQKMYNNSEVSMADRIDAGIKLGYWDWQINAHELVGRLFRGFKFRPNTDRSLFL